MKLANYYGDAEVHVSPIMTNGPSGKVRITISVLGESLTADVSSAGLIHQAKRSLGNDPFVSDLRQLLKDDSHNSFEGERIVYADDLSSIIEAYNS